MSFWWFYELSIFCFLSCWCFFECLICWCCVMLMCFLNFWYYHFHFDVFLNVWYFDFVSFWYVWKYVWYFDVSVILIVSFFCIFWYVWLFAYSLKKSHFVSVASSLLSFFFEFTMFWFVLCWCVIKNLRLAAGLLLRQWRRQVILWMFILILSRKDIRFKRLDIYIEAENISSIWLLHKINSL